MQPGLTVEVGTLTIADYGCWLDDGSFCPVVFERKTLGDLYSTMTHGYIRFKRMLNKAQQLKQKVVLIIESSFTDVANGYQHSKFEGRAMIRKLMTMWIRYDLFPVFCCNRQESAAYIKTFYECFNKNLKKK